ncbi:MAG TPA: nucleotidyltransferase family protein [Humibacillus sp.]|nr:nucleotidyltransferase family protein [Humibacillus sp.]
MTSPPPSTDPHQSAPPRHGRTPHVRGLVLAAGAGRRMGGPKALLRVAPDEPTLVEQAVDLLTAGGCDGVTVVVGAAGDEVEVLVRSLGRDVDIARCPDWDEGMGASLRAGLTALAAATHEGEGLTEAALVTLVDLPDLTAEVVARVLNPAPAAALGSEARWRAMLRRAAYGGLPGHPALIGRDHWQEVAREATGDQGARGYFRTHAHDLVECGDLATGRDADTPGQLGELGGPSSP